MIALGHGMHCGSRLVAYSTAERISLKMRQPGRHSPASGGHVLVHRLVGPLRIKWAKGAASGRRQASRRGMTVLHESMAVPIRIRARDRGCVQVNGRPRVEVLVDCDPPASALSSLTSMHQALVTRGRFFSGDLPTRMRGNLDHIDRTEAETDHSLEFEKPSSATRSCAKGLVPDRYSTRNARNRQSRDAGQIPDALSRGPERSSLSAFAAI
jgi:hypothetical protein